MNRFHRILTLVLIFFVAFILEVNYELLSASSKPAKFTRQKTVNSEFSETFEKCDLSEGEWITKDLYFKVCFPDSQTTIDYNQPKEFRRLTDKKDYLPNKIFTAYCPHGDQTYWNTMKLAWVAKNCSYKLFNQFDIKQCLGIKKLTNKTNEYGNWELVNPKAKKIWFIGDSTVRGMAGELVWSLEEYNYQDSNDEKIYNNFGFSSIVNNTKGGFWTTYGDNSIKSMSVKPWIFEAGIENHAQKGNFFEGATSETTIRNSN